MHPNQQQAIKTSLWSTILNIIMVLAKGITGYFGNSFALLADAIESTADVFSSTLVYMGLKYSSRPADHNHPYGHGRAEALITFLVVGFLIVSAAFITIESIHNIYTPHELPAPYTLIVLGVIIVIKEIFYRLAVEKGKKANSSALKADAFHHRADALTSLTAFIGISIALYMGKGYESADDWAALFAVIIILYNSYKIFRPALGEIMDEHVFDEMVAEIRQIAQTVDGIIATEKCFIRKTGMNYYVDLHAVVNKHLTVEQGHAISHNLKDAIREKLPEVANVLVHIEPGE
ncbi:MAG TPA: cation diffusion facilitator family transporter [Flavobacteriales bacterium]|nr:cation diffusion facilitator family transporter [Flavobacteriales bacterium]